MRSYSRRLLLFAILATTVSAALVVLAIGVVRDPRPSTAAPRMTTAPDHPEPIETEHSRDLTRVLEGSTVLPHSIKLDRPFGWRPNRLHGVDYGETYSAQGAMIDAGGSWQAGVMASVARVDRKKLHELLQRSGDRLEVGGCAPPERARPETTCVARVLPDGTKATVTLSDGSRSAKLNAVRPDGSEIHLGFQGVSGARSDDDHTFDVDTLFRFAELPGLHL
ncbi:hypothetical protein SAMN05192558_102148 [Actinokineospora alba]|uniref:Uncharacterized protein n=1 Tax=Actinokineospora alba TaxID=504798 RepID=A0A1H0HJV4_9PSEU|nr:hypothetical protein [Actinokineospora alba]TDP64855.1 hypothetical protein C8E96_0330 [Actinokineospora alba]SDH47598.1 hypothetical protein SAMN05421871_101155 [Actinokineospora alba]SDO19475.1 hypothetical protein SAMN05192558_102148 [Actinokineospora alba]